MPELADKVAMVTGGAGDVGRVIVTRLAHGGAQVILNCFHSYAAGKQLSAELRGQGLDVRVMRGSVAKPEHVQ
jgi:NAD(P)-dependent dehydrogenase (short-subunit alcohol dehydrogenase family)